jgi:4-diphosphocytidyl-2-C-methyl-D-erythritol kinase
MVLFPNAKINLGLNIITKRPDGYHELETCFFPVPWKDVLEIVESDKTELSTSGIKIPEEGSNIVLKAYQLLAENYDLSPIRIHLHKAIPIGAGLGGGSADAAFAIKLLKELFELDMDEAQMIHFASILGADCAFFIKNKPSLAYGIGEKLSGLDLSLAGKFILLIYPDLHISTKVAFSGIVPKRRTNSIADILNHRPISEWKKGLVNDFEKSVFSNFPVLKSIKSKLYEAGAEYASMSGSGSCMYGIFDKETEVEMPSSYNIWSGIL